MRIPLQPTLENLASWGILARITLSGGGGPAQHEANARLIAAAPRMAKALYRIAEVFGINDANLNDDQKEALREAAEAHDQAVRP